MFIYPIHSVLITWDPADGITPDQRWGGAQRLLSSTANNLVEQNIEFIEFWMRIQNAPADASLFLDLGLISEDVIPDGLLNTEDRINENDAIDEGEDTGLDGFFDAQERVNFPDARDRGDPSGDNFVLSQTSSLDPMVYYKINGTEGNAVLTDVGRLPDTEDLNRTVLLMSLTVISDMKYLLIQVTQIPLNRVVDLPVLIGFYIEFHLKTHC